VLSGPMLGAIGVTLALADAAAPAIGQAPGPPAVTTSPATLVHVGSARLGGSVDPNGLDTTYSFQYGTTTSYGSSTSVADAGAGNRAVSVQAPISGLRSGTTYHYRLTAANAAGTDSSPDTTFTTCDPRLKGDYAVRVRVVASGGALGERHARRAHRLYHFDPHCGTALCPTVHLRREGRKGKFGSLLRRQSSGVYEGTERFQGGRCTDGLRFHSVAPIRIAARRLSGDTASAIRGRLKIRARGCVDGHERVRLRGTLGR